MRKNIFIIFVALLLFSSCKLTQDKENYKITSVVYITDWGEKPINIKETVYTMLSKLDLIYIKSYKVNNIKIDSKFYGEQFLHIDKNLAIPYKKE